jgi:hypothetical protein
MTTRMFPAGAAAGTGLIEALHVRAGLAFHADLSASADLGGGQPQPA